MGIALADSNLYRDGYVTPAYLDTRLSGLGGSTVGGRPGLIDAFNSFGASIIAIPLLCDIDASTSLGLTDGQCFLTGIYIDRDTIVTGVRFAMATIGDYTADNNNRIGLYKVSGGNATLVASTANNGDLWKGAQYSWIQHAFSSPYNAEKGAYYIGFIYNNSAQTTAPAVYAGEITNLSNMGSFFNEVRIKGTISNITDLPNSFQTNGISGDTASPMMILY